MLPFLSVTQAAGAYTAIADGLTEETTTALAKLPDLFVTARQSSMVYRHEIKDARQISLELGVSYLVEGSVEINDRSLRINVRLVAGDSGSIIWADLFNQDLIRFFEARDRIVEGIVGSMLPSMVRHEINQAFDRKAENLDAWLHLQGRRAISSLLEVQSDWNRRCRS